MAKKYSDINPTFTYLTLKSINSVRVGGKYSRFVVRRFDEFRGTKYELEAEDTNYQDSFHIWRIYDPVYSVLLRMKEYWVFELHKLFESAWAIPNFIEVWWASPRRGRAPRTTKYLLSAYRTAYMRSISTLALVSLLQLIKLFLTLTRFDQKGVMLSWNLKRECCISLIRKYKFLHLSPMRLAISM